VDSCRSWLVRMESVCRQFSKLASEPVTLADGAQVEVVGLALLNGYMRLLVRDQWGQEEHIDVVEVLNG
jgi:hypothetical protein